MTRIISAEELSKHNHGEDLWLAIGDVVYDMTEFAPTHPGGFDIILKSAGRDATAVYSSVHSPYLLQHQLDSSKTVGKLDPNTIPSFWSAKSTIPSAVDGLGEAHPHARWRAKARI